MFLLAVVTIIGVFAEIFSLGMALPFISVILTPEKIFNHPWSQPVLDAFNINSSDDMLLPITIVFIFMVILSGAIRLGHLWWLNRFANAVGNDLGTEAFSRTLYQPYIVHSQRNSSEIGALFVKKIDIIIYSLIVPLLTLASSLLIVLSTVLLMMFISVKISGSAFFFFGGLYLFVIFFSKKFLARDSQLLTEKQGQVAKVVQESLGGIRDVLIDDLQKIYIRIFGKVDNELRRALCNIHIIAGAPKPVVETFSLALIGVLVYILAGQEGGIISILPTLGALILAAQRILPLVQQSYTSWSYIQGSKHTLVDVLELLDQPVVPNYRQLEAAPLAFDDKISFNDVWFSYTENSSSILHGINLEIPRGYRVGFIGATGSGKSSLLDILMGLLSASSGQVCIDGTTLSQTNIRAWQKHIAHVPQSIYLIDATIAENIALGSSLDEIDWERLKIACDKAQITDTVKKLDGGFISIVGENGIRLSGGQRQRIGLARALYKLSDVIILDEATSALDSATEDRVMSAIETLDQSITIIMIAHRLTTLKYCDIIYELEDGKIISSGTYDETVKQSQYFDT